MADYSNGARSRPMRASVMCPLRHGDCCVTFVYPARKTSACGQPKRGNVMDEPTLQTHQPQRANPAPQPQLSEQPQQPQQQQQQQPPQTTPSAQQDINPGDDAAPGTPGTGEVDCPDCSGSGQLNDRPCQTCGGTGKVVKAVGGA
ncbi:hypothetical protein DVB37_18920 [Achromobacter sp. B7]|uniref:hypothetical protein n=1 Tax=Achromobacter sp. B7 TaxID=2282475 RepID=UPI000E74E34E|nr:hypothetical protein [Achromobacter sp. B7]AYD65757.1 hypothetical protein DVB37_18920 [Achromobacter sp. B7]